MKDLDELEQQALEQMDKVDMIYEIVKGVRTDLKEHIYKEEKRDEKYINLISDLKTANALTKQREKMVNASISAVVAGLIAWLVVKFGGGGGGSPPTTLMGG